ncbi:hypothetical protein CBL_11260 [Carabus blaptoides fortunei]
MKTSVVFFVGFFLFGCVGAKPQNGVKGIGRPNPYSATSVTTFNEGILKTLWEDILAVLPVDEAKQFYEQLKNSPQWKAFADLITGKDLQKIIDQFHEPLAFKMLVDYYFKIVKYYEQLWNAILSQATNISTF